MIEDAAQVAGWVGGWWAANRTSKNLNTALAERDAIARESLASGDGTVVIGLQQKGDGGWSVDDGAFGLTSWSGGAREYKSTIYGRGKDVQAAMAEATAPSISDGDYRNVGVAIYVREGSQIRRRTLDAEELRALPTDRAGKKTAEKVASEMKASSSAGEMREARADQAGERAERERAAQVQREAAEKTKQEAQEHERREAQERARLKEEQQAKEAQRAKDEERRRKEEERKRREQQNTPPPAPVPGFGSPGILGRTADPDNINPRNTCGVCVPSPYTAARDIALSKQFAVDLNEGRAAFVRADRSAVEGFVPELKEHFRVIERPELRGALPEVSRESVLDAVQVPLRERGVREEAVPRR